MAFPTSPSDGDTHDQNGSQYIFDGTYNTWIITGVAGATPFDIGRYEKSLSISDISIPYGGAISPDGTKFYVLGVGGLTKAVYQYTLSTPFDISSGVYSEKSLSVSGQIASGYEMRLSSDGTKLYVLSSAKVIEQYTLSTAWDISSGTYDSKNISVSSVASNPKGFYISPDGSKLFVIGTTTDAVHAYNLSTSFDISTASSISESLSVSAEDLFPHSVFFSNDGTKMAILGRDHLRIYQYTLSTAWDLTSGTFDKEDFSLGSTDAVATLIYSDSGDKIYVIEYTARIIYQYRV